MHLNTEDYRKLTDAVLAMDYFVAIIEKIHAEGNFLDPVTGEILTKGSPRLQAKFDEALSVVRQRCNEGLSVARPGLQN